MIAGIFNTPYWCGKYELYINLINKENNKFIT